MFLRTLIASLIVSSVSYANVAPPQKAMRLIETGQGIQTWMTEVEVDAMAAKIHEAGRCGGYMDVTDYPAQPRAYLAPFDFRIFQIRHEAVVRAALPYLSEPKLKSWIEQLSAFPSRYYNIEGGKKAAEWLESQFSELGKSRSDVSVQFFRHEKWKQPSVIARIQGKGPHANETVILGAHLDSIQWGFAWPVPQGKAPGADDDASGIATLLETFRVLMETDFSPDRSIEFIAYAGEEKGLLGSQEIARQYRSNNREIVAITQFDMTMFPGANTGINFIMDNTHPELTEFGKKLTETYVGVPWFETQCGYGCSDHASWNKEGYATVFPFESTFDSMNKKIHTENDLIQYLDIAHGLQFAKFAVAFAIEMSGN